MNDGYWGYHLLENCVDCDQDLITSEANVREYVSELIDAIDMVAFGPCHVHRFATHDVEKAGLSFFQLIETSHIAGHFCENTNEAYLDLFSCKPFDIDKAKAVAYKYFRHQRSNARIIYRDGANFY